MAEAIAEVEREAQVRIRCFDRWISEGKVSRVDAWDRMERILSAVNYLRAAEARVEKEALELAGGEHPPANIRDFRADQKGIVESLDTLQAEA